MDPAVLFGKAHHRCKQYPSAEDAPGDQSSPLNGSLRCLTKSVRLTRWRRFAGANGNVGNVARLAAIDPRGASKICLELESKRIPANFFASVIALDNGTRPSINCRSCFTPTRTADRSAMECLTSISNDKTQWWDIVKRSVCRMQRLAAHL